MPRGHGTGSHNPSRENMDGWIWLLAGGGRGEGRREQIRSTKGSNTVLVCFQPSYIPSCPVLLPFFVLATAGRLGGGSGPFQLGTSLILIFCFVLIFWAFGFWLAGWRAGGRWGSWSVGEKGKGLYFFFFFFGSFLSCVGFTSFSLRETH